MGIYESKNNNINKENDQTNEIIKKNELIKINEINKKNNRIKECIIEESKFEPIDSYITNVSKSICKLKIKNGIQNILGTGFLLKFYIDQECFYCLISNEHVITQNIINNNNNIIYIYYDSEYKVANIKLNIINKNKL